MDNLRKSLNRRYATLIRYFRDETGMYVDWQQLQKLPEIDTLVDIGVGPMGTPELYDLFPNAKLLLIDPLSESSTYILEHLQNRDVSFYNCAVGDRAGTEKIHVQDEIGSSSILVPSSINFEHNASDQRDIQVKTLDSIYENEKNLGKLGIKIDTEGFELNVIKGARETLKTAEFVLAEVRHNHESFLGVYKLHEFVAEMHKHGFVLSMILTAKPFIADLCFQPIKRLEDSQVQASGTV